MGSASAKSNITTSPWSISRGGRFTRDKAVDTGVYCVDGQARGFFLDEMSSLLPYLTQIRKNFLTKPVVLVTVILSRRQDYE